MFNLNTGKISEQMFRKLDNQVVYDLQSASLGFYDGNKNLMTLATAGNGRKSLNSTPIDASVAVPAIAVFTKVQDLSVGDVVFSPQNGCGFFLKADIAKVLKDGEKANDGDLDNDFITVLKNNNERCSMAVAKNPMLGMGVLAVKSLSNAGMANSLPMMLMFNKGIEENGSLSKIIAMSMISGNNMFDSMTDNGNGMNGMMMAMIMGDGEIDMKTMMMMSMMGGTENKNMNSLLPLMVLGDSDGMDDILPMIMMSMMGQGQEAGGDLSNVMQTMLMLELFRD